MLQHLLGKIVLSVEIGKQIMRTMTAMSRSTISVLTANITMRGLRLLVEQCLVKIGRMSSIGQIGQVLIRGRNKKQQPWWLLRLRIWRI